MTYHPVIGLEIHIQLATASKIFSPAKATYCTEPNQQVREVDGGMPGALPVLNREAVRLAVRLGFALQAEICELSEFARKNYFYPDLPKGYQISQFEYPLIRGGQLTVPVGDGKKTINITRAHLEEDAGKLVHGVGGGSGVDLNRASAPLLEVVSEPEMLNIEEAASYARTMHQLACWLDTCDGNMQEGSFRIDANISLHRAGEPLGTRCEIKNLNSFRFLEQALEYEMSRQREVLESGQTVTQQTRLFDSASGQTRAMRDKEDAHDYRYFPDPDLPPLLLSAEWLADIRSTMPELPAARRARFVQDLQLNEYDAGVLTATRSLSDYYENTLTALLIAQKIEVSASDKAAAKSSAKLCANWICGEVSAMLNRQQTTADKSPVSAEHLGALLSKLAGGDISAASAKIVWEKMWESGDDPQTIIEREGLSQISDSGALEDIAAKIIADNPGQVKQYQEGKERLFGFFVGQIMRETSGRGNPKQINDILHRLLSADNGK